MSKFLASDIGPKDDLTRIPSFNSWSRRKLLVLHMETAKLDIESCLEMAEIPFISMEYDEGAIIKKIEREADKCFGIVITGSVDSRGTLPAVPTTLFEKDLPKIGVCYGYEALGQYLGANLIYCNPPFGEKSEVIVTLKKSLLFEGLDISEPTMVTMAHEFTLDKVPPGCCLIASTELSPVAGFECLDKGIFGLQFHPEKGWMGDIIFKNFFNFCVKQNKLK